VDITSTIGHSLALLKEGRGADAEQAIVPAMASHPDDPSVWLAAAQIAEANGALISAACRWEQARTASPSTLAGWIGGCELALRLSQGEKVEALLREALARFPDDFDLQTLEAKSLALHKDWNAAARAWKKLLAQRPADPSLAHEAAQSLLGTPQGRRHRTGMVLEILRPLIANHPDYETAFSLFVATLLDSGDTEAAWTAGCTLHNTAPGNVELAIACANAALSKGAFAAAAALLLNARRTVETPSPEFEAVLIRAWSQAGEHDRAEKTGTAALERFPGDSRIVEQHVVAAMRRGALDVAEQRARFWSEKFPDSLALKKLITRVAPSAASPGVAKWNEQNASAALFMRFESLGAQRAGCDFGGIQAQFGANPVSLLRWANMGLEGLVYGLGCDFEGLGVPEHTRMETRRVGSGEEEYFVEDDRFSYVAHTFIKTHEAPADQVFKQTLRRIRFLREKLLEDLKAAERIFVFKLGGDYSREKLQLLFSTLRRHGPNMLLCVALSDAEQTAGTIQQIEPGLILGRVSCLGGAADPSRRGTDSAGWQSICQLTAALQDEGERRQH